MNKRPKLCDIIRIGDDVKIFGLTYKIEQRDNKRASCTLLYVEQYPKHTRMGPAPYDHESPLADQFMVRKFAKTHNISSDALLHKINEANIHLTRKHFIITHTRTDGINDVPNHTKERPSTDFQETECNTRGVIRHRPITLLFTNKANGTDEGFYAPDVIERRKIGFGRLVA